MNTTYRAVISVAAVGLAIVSLLIFANAQDVRAEDGGSPIFSVRLPEGYRDWKVISVAHEAGNNNDIRAVLGNDVAMRAFRNGVRPFPDGTIVARLAYKYVASDQNNAIFGRVQSFVAGDPTNVQISVKDSKKYASTGGWGYGQFENGKPNMSVELINTCFACHTRLDSGRDLMFTNYAP